MPTPFNLIRDIHLREVVAGASVAFLLRSGAVLAMLAFNIALARSLGASGAGIYFLSFTVITICSVLGRLGLDQAVVRFTAAEASAGRWDKVKGLYTRSMALCLAASAVATAALVLLSGVISGPVFAKPEMRVPLIVMGLGIVPFSLMTLHSEFLRGLKKIRDSLLVHWQGLLLPLVSLPILLYLAPSMRVTGAAAAFSTASVLVLAVAYTLFRSAAFPLKRTKGSFSTGLLLSTSLPLLLVASVNFVMNWTDTIMLGLLTKASEVGIYNAALRTAVLAGFSLSVFNTISAPKFSELYSQGAADQLSSLARKSTKIMIAAALPVCLVFWILPGLIMSLYGPEFSRGTAALQILTAGQFINVAVGSVAYLLLMTGHEKFYSNVILGTSVLNILLNLALIPRLGINGAALATSISLAVMNIIAFWAVVKKLGIKTVG